MVATLDALLTGVGFRTARYTSPHLVDFGERMLVGGRPVPSEFVASWVTRWTPEIERIGATFFEATTCMAFDWFARAEADVAVIEVGLGGRLDATNVVMPEAACVVSLALEHQQFLGDTLEEIAYEKAGIFKPGKPALIGEPDERLSALLSAHARELGASPVHAIGDAPVIQDVRVTERGTSFTLDVVSFGDRSRTPRVLQTSLIGAHQARNAALAIMMLESAGSRYHGAAADAERSLDAVTLPGRFDRRAGFIFDVAHNPASARALAETLDAVRPAQPVVALVGVLGDKDWRSMLDTLAPHVGRFVLTSAPSVPRERAWSPSEASEYIGARGIEARAEPNFAVALRRAGEGAGTVLVAGSFHTVGDAMVGLQLSPYAE